jgi:type IV pilus assembly protein PilN
LIKINLAKRKTAPIASSAQKISVSGLNLEELKELPLKKYALVAVLLFLGNYLSEEEKGSLLQSAQAELNRIRQEVSQAETAFQQARRYEEEKNELEKEEALIRQKIETVRTLLEGREGAVRLLTAISSTIPKEVWLMEIRKNDRQLSMRGGASNFNTVSDFMRTLGRSAYVSDLELGSTQQQQGARGGHAEFRLSARVR